MRPSVARPFALLAGPVLWRQGVQVRARTPALPEAEGPRRGTVGDPPWSRLLVVGESTAAGVGVAHQHEGLGAQLAACLAGSPVVDGHGGVAWEVVARSGVTARVLHDQVLAAATPAPHDLAVVVLGVNDTLRLRTARTWRRDVTRVIDALAATAAPGARTVLAGVPDLAGFPALPTPLSAVLGAHARHLDAVLARLASRRGDVLHVPVPAAGDQAYAADGFHPGVDGYARWAEHLAAAVHATAR